ncbi:MAG: EAL domain-containing protein [Desulfobacteraceae bacterium]|nr:MAG: EAL domain-containing protein [Desulfobacteraceae bacterium]
MTLYRQLIIFTLILFLLLFAGTWYAKLDSTRSFLVDQLESHAQDTATSLGLSVSQHVIKNDMPSVESMINAVFDRGYYETIKLVDARQKIMIDRVLSVKIENVPPWFIRWIPLETPEASANVMSGWIQAGTIVVKSHPGYAYKTLWEDMVSTTRWFIACGLFVLIAGGFGLRFLLKPLVLVERQADAICRKEYEVQERMPWTKELRRVVEAMNRMTHKVKEMFEEQVTHAEGLRERSYHDPVTGLGNRRYFDTQITARLDRRDSVTKGILLLIKLNDLDKLNQLKGFQAGDEFLKRVATLLSEATKQYASCALARISGGDFGIFLPDAPPWDAETIAGSVANKLSQIAAEQLVITDNIGYVGAATYEVTTTLSRLLSEADLALTAARQAGPNGWIVRAITEETDKAPLGQQQWKEMLEKALRERRISLDAQPVVKTTDRNHLLHLEIFSRIIREDGKFLSAGVFMPLAERLNLVSSIDRIVLEEVMQLDSSRLSVGNIAVNVSSASLQDEAFRQWLQSSLKALSRTAPRIIFEFSEFSAVQNLNLIKDFSIFVREYGHAMGLDHYGQSFSNLGYLKSMRPDYVKIDRAYTGELKDEESDSRFFIGSLCSVAHSIDIKVIAEGVETEQQWQILRELNLDAIQGYIVDKPKPIKGMMKT